MVILGKLMERGKFVFVSQELNIRLRIFPQAALVIFFTLFSAFPVFSESDKSKLNRARQVTVLWTAVW